MAHVKIKKMSKYSTDYASFEFFPNTSSSSAAAVAADTASVAAAAVAAFGQLARFLACPIACCCCGSRFSGTSDMSSSSIFLLYKPYFFLY
jgi:hypothetical protein